MTLPTSTCRRADPGPRPARAFAVAALSVLVAGAASAADPIELANGNDYVPFSDESLPEGGLAAELVDRAAALLGREVEYAWLDWDVGYERARRGEFDGTLPYFFNAERDADFFFSDSIYTVVERLFLKSDAAVVPEGEDDIDGQRLCSPVGYAVAGAVERLVAAGRATREQPEDMTRCFELLELGRVDAVLANVLQGWDKVGGDRRPRPAERAHRAVGDRAEHPEPDRVAGRRPRGLPADGVAERRHGHPAPRRHVRRYRGRATGRDRGVRRPRTSATAPSSTTARSSSVSPAPTSAARSCSRPTTAGRSCCRRTSSSRCGSRGSTASGRTTRIAATRGLPRRSTTTFARRPSPPLPT